RRCGQAVWGTLVSNGIMWGGTGLPQTCDQSHEGEENEQFVHFTAAGSELKICMQCGGCEIRNLWRD
ncbi:hypothetical protein GDO86_002193, partial [Hymenochirus boettgeri]